MTSRIVAGLLLATSLFVSTSFAQDEKKSEQTTEEKELTPSEQIQKLIKEGKLREAAESLDESIEADPKLVALRRSLASAFARRRNYKGASEQYEKFAAAMLESDTAPVAQIVSAVSIARIYMPRGGRAKEVLPMLEAANEKVSAKVDMAKASNELRSLLTLHSNLALTMRSEDREAEAMKLLRDDLTRMSALHESDDSTVAVECHAMAMRHLFGALPPGDERAGLFNEHQKMLGAMLDEGNNLVFTSYATAAMQQLSLLARDQPEVAQAIVTDLETRMEAVSDDRRLSGMVRSYERSLASYKRRIEAAIRMAKLIGQKAPEFDVAAWVSEDGEPVDLKGKVVLLDFWAIWCGPCIRTFPHLKHLQEEYGDQGFQVVGVTRYYNYTWDEEKERPVRGKRGEEGDPAAEHETIRKFLASHGLTHPSIVTPNETEMQTEYAVTGIPHAVVIDREGIVRLIKVGSGSANAEAIEAKIKELLGSPTAE